METESCRNFPALSFNVLWLASHNKIFIIFIFLNELFLGYKPPND